MMLGQQAPDLLMVVLPPAQHHRTYL
jgi:hypothetical protein